MKVTLLGDSIRQIGYGLKVPELLGEEYEVYQPDDNCRFSKYTLRGLFDWKSEMEGSQIVHWNNGLWDICSLFDDEPFCTKEEYLTNMLKIAEILTQRYDKVIFATTTPVNPKHPYNRNEVIQDYNASLIPCLKEKGIIINDLFSIVYPHISEYICDDFIHLSEAGIKVCSEQVARVIKKVAEGIVRKENMSSLNVREDKKFKYERLEWDYTWLEHVEDETVDKVLYIGDSISVGIRTIATEKSDKKIYFDNFGTSKGLDNPYLQDSIKFFAMQQPNRSAVIFNNGLHAFDLDDDTEYKFYYEKMIEFLLEEFKGTPLLIALSTHVAHEGEDEGGMEARVINRNHIASCIAEKYNLPIIDLYTVSLNNAQLLSEDGIHYTNQGYEVLAEEILRVLKQYI